MKAKIKKQILDSFNHYLCKYEESKYPNAIYKHARKQFSDYDNAPDVKAVLIWKYGHNGKSNFPSSHKRMIVKVKKNWGHYIGIKEVFHAQHTFYWWRKKLGKTAFITAAWITHLIHYKEGVPIIDRHNYRAMNLLKQAGDSNHANFKRKPSNWNDVVELQEFINEIRKTMPTKSLYQIDRFLMMYGKYHVKHC